MESTLNLQSPWEEVKDLIKEHDLSLTDADLEYQPGHEDELLSRLSKKMKKDKQAVREYIESLSSNSGRAS
jgi:hypothetical protein